jgi:hypothetical protein
MHWDIQIKDGGCFGEEMVIKVISISDIYLIDDQFLFMSKYVVYHYVLMTLSFMLYRESI